MAVLPAQEIGVLPTVFAITQLESRPHEFYWLYQCQVLATLAGSRSITWAPATSTNNSAMPGWQVNTKYLVGLGKLSEGLGRQTRSFLVEVDQHLVHNHGQAFGVLSEFPYQPEPQGQVKLFTSTPAQFLGCFWRHRRRP